MTWNINFGRMLLQIVLHTDLDQTAPIPVHVHIQLDVTQ